MTDDFYKISHTEARSTRGGRGQVSEDRNTESCTLSPAPSFATFVVKNHFELDTAASVGRCCPTLTSRAILSQK